MARLFPKIDPSEIENPGERKVAEALVSQLSSQVEVFHSFNWLGTNQRGQLVEGESDFVIIDPFNGILCVEVKGGSLEFDTKRTEWLRVLPTGQQRSINKDPFEQARVSMHEVVKRVRNELPLGGADLPFTYGYAVAFPDCSYTGSLPASITSDLVLDATKCRDLKPSVQRVFDNFRRRPHDTLSAKQIEACHEALYPKFAILPVLWRKVEDQEERLKRLTTEQQGLLDFLGNHTKAAIHGVAGSGKTILALAKAQETARRGMRTLFLCYNRPLKDWLQQAIPEDFGDNLVIDTYHGLVDDLCRIANVPFRPASNRRDSDFWESDAPECLMQACDLLGSQHKFDGVIVDEGQDFHDLWWTSLDGVFRSSENKGCYYVFYDPYQNLYVENPSIPGELGTPFELPVNCRNTVRIAAHCAALVGQPSRVRDGAPLGDEPEVVQVKTLRDGFNEAGRLVRSLCMPTAGGLKTSQVAVLAPGSTERDWPNDFQTIAATRDFDQWRNNKGVLIASWNRFKGLEADAVLILQPPVVESVRDDANRYVAHSRAKHLLTLINIESM